MTLPAGTRLGPFEVVAPLGAGGMGEVYRARDARLGRDVALKVLPAAVATDAERLRRFEKEARAASALNHPNLVTLHDVGSSDGVEYIAMELVEGRTLREVLADGPIATRRLLAIAAQTSDGLAKAHGAGIVHRDLKPENLMISSDGFVKILDFGLAKLTQPDAATGHTGAPTVSGATEPGVVMGTAGYMSPEQALGRPTDFRSDQFSLGSILYEMATGRKAFSRDSAPETLTAIIRDEPEPIGRLAPLSPAPLSWVVERCLAKAPDDRYASTRDLARDLATLRDRVSETSGAAAAARVETPRTVRSGWLPWAVAAGLAAIAAALWAAGRRPATAPVPVVRFSVTMPEGVRFENGEIEGQHAISPDGRRLVFVGGTPGRRRLYLRSLDSLDTQPLEGTESAVSPFWSPDSRSLGFFADGKLQRLDFGAGPPRVICDAPSLETLPSWGSSGQILFAQIGPAGRGVLVVDASGGTPRPVGYEDADERRTGVWSSFLPDGKRFLFLSRDFESRDDRWHLMSGSLESPKTTEITDTIQSRVAYVKPGYLIYASRGALLARRFDAETLRLSGEAVTLAERIYYFNGPAQAGFSASEAGVVTYEKLVLPSRMAWRNRSGHEIETVPLEGVIGSVRISPDGRTIAAQVQDEKQGTSDIWLYDLSRRLPVRLTLETSDEQSPVWSADGTRILFRSDQLGPPDIWQVPVSSPGHVSVLFRRDGVQQADDASADGKFAVFTEWNRRTNGDLWLLPLSEGAQPRVLEQRPYSEAGARFSPNGRFLAYVSGEAGTLEVYVRPLQGSGERIRVSAAGGRLPRWRRDGSELFYLAPNGDLVTVPMRSADRPDPGSPSVLFRLDGDVRDYDVDPSGQRFLVNTAPVDTAPIGVLLNWPALVPGEVRR